MFDAFFNRLPTQSGIAACFGRRIECPPFFGDAIAGGIGARSGFGAVLGAIRIFPVNICREKRVLCKSVQRSISLKLEWGRMHEFTF